MDAVAGALRRLERQRMVTQVDAMVEAFRRDLIDAADFGRSPGAPADEESR